MNKFDYDQLCKSIVLTMLMSCCMLLSMAHGQSVKKENRQKENKVFVDGYFNYFPLSPDSLQAISRLIEQSDTGTKDSILFNLGVIFRSKANYNFSTFYFIQGLEFSQELDSLNLMAKYQTNLGINNDRLGDHAKSRLFYRKALASYRALKDTLRESYLYNNISLQFFREGKYDSALLYYEKSVKLKEQLGKSGLDLHPNNPGQIYHQLGEYSKAIQYHQLAIDLLAREEERNYLAESQAHQFLADVYRDMAAYEKALDHYQTALQLSQKVKAREITNQALEGITMIYQIKKEYKQALYFAELQKSHLDTLARYSNQTAALEARHQIKLQRQNMELLKTQSEVALGNKNLIIIIISSCILLLVAVIVFISYTYKQKLQSERLLSKQNELLTEQKINQAMKEQELKSLKAFVEGQEEERIRVARDLHDGLGGTLASLKLNFEQSLEEPGLPDHQQVINGLEMVYKEVRSVAGNLAPPKFQSTYFTDILHGYIKHIADVNKILINAEFQPEDDLNALPEKTKIEIYRIIQELTNNTIKHAAATKIAVQLLVHPGFVNLTVEDNGKGFNAGKKYRGMGISNVQSRVAIMNGTVDIDSGVNRGTLFNIDIPIITGKSL